MTNATAKIKGNYGLKQIYFYSVYYIRELFASGFFSLISILLSVSELLAVDEF